MSSSPSASGPFSSRTAQRNRLAAQSSGLQLAQRGLGPAGHPGHPRRRPEEHAVDPSQIGEPDPQVLDRGLVPQGAASPGRPGKFQSARGQEYPFPLLYFL